MSDFLDRLLDEEKASLRPPDGAKEATWTALEDSLAAGAPAPIELPTPGAPLPWIAGLICGASGIAVMAYLATRPAVEPPVSPPPPPVEVTAPIEAPEPSPPVPVPEQRRPRPKPPRPSLAVQIAELRQAQLAFSRGQPAAALELVEAHRRKFPQSPLEQERSALEVLAACRVRKDDGAELAKKFLERWPSSPQVDRVRRACD